MANGSGWWSHPGQRLAFLRQVHSYIGAFIAPSVLFFALTGAVQLFSLHEARDGYTPAPIVEKLAKVHKDQVFAGGKKRPEPKLAAVSAAPKADPKPDADEDHDKDREDADHAPGGAKPATGPDKDHAEAAVAPKADAGSANPPSKPEGKAKRGARLGTYLLKWTFLVVAVGLALSTLVGLWMALAHSRHKATIWALLLLGTVLPVVLLLF